jgi:hypothetical protein
MSDVDTQSQLDIEDQMSQKGTVAVESAFSHLISIQDRLPKAESEDRPTTARQQQFPHAALFGIKGSPPSSRSGTASPAVDSPKLGSDTGGKAGSDPVRSELRTLVSSVKQLSTAVSGQTKAIERLSELLARDIEDRKNSRSVIEENLAHLCAIIGIVEQQTDRTSVHSREIATAVTRFAKSTLSATTDQPEKSQSDDRGKAAATDSQTAVAEVTEALTQTIESIDAVEHAATPDGGLRTLVSPIGLSVTRLPWRRDE